MYLSTILDNNLPFYKNSRRFYQREPSLLLVKIVYAPVGIEIGSDITVR